MKNWIVLVLIACVLVVGRSCDKVENDYMNNIPEGLQLLRQVNTYYGDYMVIDTFYYSSDYELTCFERREDSMINRIYFRDKRLKEQEVSVNVNCKMVSFYINYLNDGTLVVANDTTAYLLSERDSLYYTRLTCFTRKPFEEWVEDFRCQFVWENGNLKSASYDREVINYAYDNKPNPLAGYVFWGFFYDGFLTGTMNNLIENGFYYQYNESGYPLYLETPQFYREYFYYE